MNRVLLTADAVGGVWTYALDLARGLRARGVSVAVAVMGPPPDARQRADAAAAGVTLHHAPFRLEWMDDPWNDVDAAGKWLLDVERQFSPDVVHLNGYCHAVLAWRAPAIVVAHSCVCSWWRAVRGQEAPSRFDGYRARVRAGLQAAPAVIAPSAAMLRALEAEYGCVPRARVVPNGCGFTPATGVAREPIVLSAGRVWDEGKNIAALCDAAASIAWPVVVAGDSRDPHGRGPSLEGVRALGALPAGDLREWFARAAIYALPARYEPFGLSVVEAARSGCALVLGDIPSLRENWDGAAAFVPPGDPRALASAIRSLIDDEARRRRLADVARQRAANFTIARMAQACYGIYREVAAPAAALIA